ncbi:hypothetical protein TH66_09620 [Carbonactinospora thermoautotrophica]|uniref:Amino acid permease n=1 Tax=Carbonactinospora thermoautotrophica TaxID=1469144 RepID=A0A132N1Z0_9ACTN|nr:amino acid permease [Carbonactinospora thermoautotrophica]KWX04148.1 hypothetical protein TH66_09620 [Carbonactinospora thermoautotrophica]KWX06468.1 hypothetical protein TR74_21920 [Carbonactinospora thermoautotrophica]
MTAGKPFRNNVFRKLPINEALAVRTGGRHSLRPVYRSRDLVVLGLGVMIGAGIFKIAGQQAATTAGPAVIASFVIGAIVMLLCALCYAELASAIPVAGSAYSFTYVLFGEIWAWLIGWAMLLELLLAAAVVSRAWSLYVVAGLRDLGIEIPAAIEPYVGQLSGFDLFAFAILVTVVFVVAVGSRLGVRVLWLMVAAKVVVIILVIGVGAWYVNPANYTPFIPAPQASGAHQENLLQLIFGGIPHVFGFAGIFTAAAVICIAYIGFDIIATAAEETKDARHDVPRGIIGSLLITIALYVGVAVVMVGMQRYDRLDPNTPLASAFAAFGQGWTAKAIGVGAVLGLSTVVLVVTIGATRVVFSMARDGLLPRPLAHIGGFRTPTRATLAVGTLAIAGSQLIDVLTLESMVVIGTLAAFLFVASGVLVLHYRRPNLERGFTTPLVPLVPLFALGSTGWLMLNLSVKTWTYFGAWMGVGLLVYAGYGQRNSRLGQSLREQLAAADLGQQELEQHGPHGAHT